MVLANPEIAMLPNWVIALVAAGGLAAALSTAAGLLLAISSAISHDLLKGMWMPDLTEKGELMAGKIAMACSIVVAGYLGLNPPDFAAGTVAIAFGLAASSIFPALMMGIFSKTMNKQGAIAGMLAGLGITMLYVFAHKGILFIKGTEFLGLFGGQANFFFGIEPNAFGAIGAIVNFAVAFAVKNMTPPVPDHIAQMVEDVRIRRIGSSDRRSSLIGLRSNNQLNLIGAPPMPVGGAFLKQTVNGPIKRSFFMIFDIGVILTWLLFFSSLPHGLFLAEKSRACPAQEELL